MNSAVRRTSIGVAGLGAGAIAALTLRRLRRRKPVRAVITLDAAPGDRGIELSVVSSDLSKEQLGQLLRELKAEIETGEIPSGERSE